MCKELEDQIARGAELAQRLVEHVKDDMGATMATIPVECNGITYEVIVRIKPEHIMPDSEYIEVPILDQFDVRKSPLGVVRMLKSAIPKTPDWVLTLGGVIKKREGNKITEYELKSVSIHSDEEHMAYLKQQQEEGE